MIASAGNNQHRLLLAAESAADKHGERIQSFVPGKTVQIELIVEPDRAATQLPEAAAAGRCYCRGTVGDIVVKPDIKLHPGNHLKKELLLVLLDFADYRLDGRDRFFRQ